MFFCSTVAQLNSKTMLIKYTVCMDASILAE